MGFDSSWRARQTDAEREKRKRMNPVWRGVGCLLIVVLGAGGYLFSNWFLVQNSLHHWIYLPPEVIRPSFAAMLPAYAVVSVAVGLLFMLFAYLALSIVYAVAFPIKPGEYDLPPLRRGRRQSRPR
jgi:hypothetical protein